MGPLSKHASIFSTEKNTPLLPAQGWLRWLRMAAGAWVTTEKRWCLCLMAAQSLIP